MFDAFEVLQVRLNKDYILKLLCMVYSEGKLQSYLERNFQNPFNNNKSVGMTYHAQKKLKICTFCRFSEAKFYLYHSNKNGQS